MPDATRTYGLSVGTRSVLYGAHAFWLHPWFVALAWWKLYGFPWDPRLWVAFFVHDLGYWGKPNMDGPEGERHPEWGARVMARLFDFWRDGRTSVKRGGGEWGPHVGRWGSLALYHSRFYAKNHGQRPSRLCMADKLAIALTPAWLYLPMATATGEIREYRALADAGGYDGQASGPDARTWFRNVQDRCRAYVEEHRDGRRDTWTPDRREALDESGVWK